MFYYVLLKYCMLYIFNVPVHYPDSLKYSTVSMYTSKQILYINIIFSQGTGLYCIFFWLRNWQETREMKAIRLKVYSYLREF